MASIQSILRVHARRSFQAGRLIWAAAILMAGAGRAAEPTFEALLREAETAYAKGARTEATSLAGRAIEAEPKDPRGYFLRGRIEAAAKEHKRAIADIGESIQREPRAAAPYQLRGVEHFMLGHIEESITDFDRFVERSPGQAPYHWQRGIAYYYAGRYEDGRKQFELHQSVNPHDVENAVWHYLCVARVAGLAKAQSALIPIQGDARVPMAQVHALFAGQGKPEDVLAAARAGDPSPERLRDQLFYAHLYLGLYYEAAGDAKRARESITRAAVEFKEDHYMGEVARVHLQLLDLKAPARASGPTP